MAVITHDDLMRLMEEYIHGSPDNLYDVLDAWDVDSEGFKEFLAKYLMLSEQSYMQKRHDMDETVMLAFMVAFVLGYKVALENEMRREVSGNEVQGT